MIFNGLNVIVSPDLPKMKLGPGDYVTREFREEIDDWLQSFFGVHNLLPDGQTIVSENTRTIWMNPRTYSRFKASIK